jgi:hypothetical protein
MAIQGHIADFAVFGTDYQTLDCTAIRDYVHASDLADAHVSAYSGFSPGSPAERSTLVPATAIRSGRFWMLLRLRLVWLWRRFLGHAVRVTRLSSSVTHPWQGRSLASTPFAQISRVL